MVARGLSREAEVVVVAVHTVYKEHIVLLMDCLATRSWMNKRAWSVEEARILELALETKDPIDRDGLIRETFDSYSTLQE